MTRRLTVALDAMGGDKAPDIVLQGADIARERFPKVDFLLFGDESVVGPQLKALPQLEKVSTLLHTDVRVSMEDKPSVALRAGRRSSMRLAIDAVAEGKADAVVSAGNTGALMAMAKLGLRPLPGVDRPAIASFFPTQRGESVMLDLGANLMCDARNLLQFALMGEIFARTALGIVAPRVGLLNIGQEELKGREEIRQAAILIRESRLADRFQGFIEGDDIGAGAVDVVVADGFTGNIALKTAEGTAKLLTHLLKEAFRNSLMARLGYLLVRPALGKFRNRVDPRRYNGAVFLGLNGVAIKSHGGTDALGFANAIGVAVDMVQHGFMDEMRKEISALKNDLLAVQEVAAG